MKKDWTAAKRRKFLNKLSQGASVYQAFTAAGFSRKAIYARRREDEQFRADWDAALEDGTDRLEDLARKRAQQGSDKMLEILLKARRPEKYRDNISHHISGQLDLNGAAARVADKLAQVLDSESEEEAGRKPRR